MDLSEDELLSAIARVLSGPGPEVVVGPGDDAAVLTPLSGQPILTTDAMVEGTHFRRELTSARDLGAKAVVVNVSDVAAMAGSPRAAVCALTLTTDLEAAWVVELLGGMREACDEYALSLVGGNLARGREITVGVAVLGEVAPGRAVLRSGAAAGERLVVTGTLGGSAAGLRVALGGGVPDDEARRLLRTHFRPVARVGEASTLARHGATAMIDVSDGLALDLSRLTGASGTGARIHLEEVPVASGATLDDALHGGEDYELIAALPSDESVVAARRELHETFGTGLAEVGVVVAGSGVQAEGADGVTHELTARGWDHFRVD